MFRVRAIDSQGLVDATPAEHMWEIDATPPRVGLGTNPPLATSADPIVFNLMCDDASLPCSFECGLDSAVPEPCTTPHERLNVPEGRHTFYVRAIDAATNPSDNTLAHVFIVDRTEPNTTIESTIVSPTRVEPVVVNLGCDEADCDFICSLSGATSTTCATPHSLSGLVDGSYQLTVAAIDSAGLQDPSAAELNFTVDRTPPETTIMTTTSSLTNLRTAAFMLSCTDAHACTFGCTLNDDPAAPCPTDHMVVISSDGDQRLAVIATDTAGNVEPVAAEHRWTVDTTPPSLTSSTSPGPQRADPTIVTFRCNDLHGCETECRAATTYAPCRSPFEVFGLADGTHTIDVRASDMVGNSTVATTRVVIDRTEPVTQLQTTTATRSSANTATFAFSCVDVHACNYSCDLDRTPSPCSSPYVTPALGEGPHQFTVTATDLAGNIDATPETFSWTVDRVGPETTLTSTPAMTTSAAPQTFEFACDDPSGCTFECRLDPAGFLPCASPHQVSSLQHGLQIFQVRARDALGNADTTPSEYSWTVDAAAPETVGVDGPPSTTEQRDNLEFTFGCDETGCRFECRLRVFDGVTFDSPPFEQCSSPANYSGLDPRAYRFEARAVDVVGNADTTPWNHEFAVVGEWAAVVGGGPTCAIANDQSAWCWGSARIGSAAHWRLGDGFQIDRTRPGPLGRVIAQWRQISRIHSHGCGRRANGDLYCWGDNRYGQIGDGTMAAPSIPVQTATVGTWQDVATGDGSTCAVHANRSLWCWGRGADARTGLGTNADRLRPEQVGTSFGWRQAALGAQHGCATRVDGTLWCWGDSGDGQTAGAGSTTTPTQIGTSTMWRTVTSYDDTVCATQIDDSLWCWGRNDAGQVGNGTVGISVFAATQIGSGWAQVQAGAEHTCGVKTDGSLWCWGLNDRGQLGDGTTATRNAPARIGLDSDWDSAVPADGATCARKTNGTLRCWGDARFGQLGTNTRGDSHRPVQVGTASNWRQVSTESGSVCATRTDGSLYCWGRNDFGQLGDGTQVERRTPVRTGAAMTWDLVETGFVYAVAIRGDGTLWGWGSNSGGNLGLGNGVSPQLSPVATATLAGWTQVAAGSQTTALAADRTIWGYGGNFNGELGDGTLTTAFTPTRMSEIGPWRSVARSTNGACAVHDDRSVWCWGFNPNNGFDASPAGPHTPARLETDFDWDRVAIGRGHVLAVKTNGTLWGRGWNAHAQLGLASGTSPTQINQMTQIDSETTWAQAVASNGGQSCAIRVDGSAFCWGQNYWGEVGVAPPATSVAPTRIPGSWLQIDVSGTLNPGDSANTTCGVRTDGTMWCWGSNRYGQLGNETPVGRCAPSDEVRLP